MSVRLAKQPPPGQKGQLYPAYANLFAVSHYPSKPIQHYNDIDPVLPAVRKRRTLFEILRTRSAPDVFVNGTFAFDGKKNLFAIGSASLGDIRAFEVDVLDGKLQIGKPSRGVYRLTLTKVGVILPDDMDAILNGRGMDIPVATTGIQAMNILVSEAAALRFKVRTRHKFFVEEGLEVFRGLEIWRGFFQSVRPASKSLLVNVDTATGVLYQRGPLLTFVRDYFFIRNLRELSTLTEYSPLFRTVRSVLKRLQVLLTHSKRIRTIKSIVCNAGCYEFNTDDGLTSVQDYFLRTKGYRLKFPNFPGVITNRDEVIPFELCEILEGQFFRGALSRDVTDKMLKIAKKRPEDRFKVIKTGGERLGLQDSPFLISAGIVVSTQLMEITGRVLEPPDLVFGRGLCIKPQAGSWNMIGKELKSPRRIDSWAVINFDPEIGVICIQKFVIGLVHALQSLGMSVCNEPPRIINQYQTTKGIMSQISAKPNLLLIILPSPSGDLWKDAKQFGDMSAGVPTQCVSSNHVKAPSRQYYNNLILKINTKLGGVNVQLSGPSIDWFKEGKTIVIGADVSHPAPGILKPSVAALVGSVDEQACKYVARCSAQTPRLEIIQHLKSMLIYILGKFHDYRRWKNSYAKTSFPVWPESIIFFRDGVSEGEISKVIEYEIKELQEAVAELYAKVKVPYKATLTFVVVGKRHHVRFLPRDSKTADKSGNCPSGFVVDKSLTCPGIFDFYLQSQAGLLGTSRPSHYIVIKDENNFSADRLQSFIFALCHIFTRSSRAVSIPAPVYYADIACSRANVHYNPKLNFPDSVSSDGADVDIEAWIKGFANVNRAQETSMYFI